MSNKFASSDSLRDGEGSPVFPSSPTPVAQLHHTYSQDHSQHYRVGTSSFPGSISPSARYSPVLVRSTSISSNKHGTRSTSVSSSRATARGFRDNSEPLSEEDEESDDGEGAERGKAAAAPPMSDEEAVTASDRDEDPITLKDRQSLINVEHPFGLPIWKPALYKKSRSVTRHADEALHSIPSAQAERHLLPGNIFWLTFFGWWLALACFSVSAMLYMVPVGGQRYASLVFGLGWYVAWPFGKYVEGDESPALLRDEGVLTGRQLGGDSGGGSEGPTIRRRSFSALSQSDQDDMANTTKAAPLAHLSTVTPTLSTQHSHSQSWNPVPIPGETSSLLATANVSSVTVGPSKIYGATSAPLLDSKLVTAFHGTSDDWLGKGCFWLALVLVIGPLMLFACIACWGLVITIPMAKLNWALIKYMFEKPTSLRFCAAPPAVVVHSDRVESTPHTADSSSLPQFSIKHPRLAAGQAAPSGSPSSTVLLCTYRAVGWQYYKYTVGGVNILFVNLLPIVFFVIFDGFILLPMVERRERDRRNIPILLAWIASRGLIFFLSLASVIPLSYFIGMAVASISAQSSIGMGAVINATFGSVIEILLYSIALTRGKGRLVEGSIVGSLLAGVLLMPGMSMCSGALRRKEQKFNAKSAGVTSMMLIMAIIGTLTPTLFYQTYGNFQLVCSGCPTQSPASYDREPPWICDHCYYKHPDPVDDPFYQSTVKELMFFCAGILLFSYLIGLWFSLRTHASQIWQNPQQLLHSMDLPVTSAQNRSSIYYRLVPGGVANIAGSQRRTQSLHRKPSSGTNIRSDDPPGSQTPVPRNTDHNTQGNLFSAPVQKHIPQPLSPPLARRVSYATSSGPQLGNQAALHLVSESVDHAVKTTSLQHLPENITSDDFSRAVAVATVSALRHQQIHSQSPARVRAPGGTMGGDPEGGTGHDAPSWSRAISASVLLGCTALYALIAELLVHVVDVILEGSGIDEKFLGVTLFALVPNTTEFMNAISFALNGNIALSMEIGSAYALQVCLLQIPAMVAFSAWYAPNKMGKVADTFTLIFPRWDVVVIILSVFLMTYTYIEAKSNYHRGSILILSYLVLTAGFYYAPHIDPDVEQVEIPSQLLPTPMLQFQRLFFSLFF